MDNDIRTQIERFKIKAERLLKENIKAFIIDTNNTYYFCRILASTNDSSVHIENFKGIRKCEKERIFWEDIVKFEEYKERGELE